MRYFFLVFLFFLTSCNSFDALKNERKEIANQIGAEEQFRVEKAAGATHATKYILDKSPNDDKFTEAARKSTDIADKALPNLSIEQTNRWDEIAEKLILGESEELQKVEQELIKSENTQTDLKKKLAEKESELFLLYERQQRDDDARIEELKSQKELQKTLVRYFFGAAAVCAIAGGILTWLLGFRIGVNAFIAGGFFGLSAYLVTQTWFAYVAAGMAVIMFAGTIYYIWGRSRPEQTMKKTADVLEKMSKSNEGHIRNAAELVKREISKSLTGKEGEAHKKYVKEVKKKL